MKCRTPCLITVFPLPAQCLKEPRVDPWYLNLYASESRIAIQNARDLLGYDPRRSLTQGMFETERWVLDQAGVQLGLTDAFGTPREAAAFPEAAGR